MVLDRRQHKPAPWTCSEIERYAHAYDHYTELVSSFVTLWALGLIIDDFSESEKDVRASISALAELYQQILDINQEMSVNRATGELDDESSTILIRIRCSIAHFTFDQDLWSTRPYCRSSNNVNQRQSAISLPSSVSQSVGWSFFSGVSISDVSDLSVLALPITANEVYNPDHLRSIVALETKSEVPVSKNPRSTDEIVLRPCLHELRSSIPLVNF